MSNATAPTTQPDSSIPTSGEARRRVIRRIARESIARNERLIAALADA